METNQQAHEPRLTHRRTCDTRAAVGCTCGVLDRWREDAEARHEDAGMHADWMTGR